MSQRCNETQVWFYEDYILSHDLKSCLFIRISLRHSFETKNIIVARFNKCRNNSDCYDVKDDIAGCVIDGMTTTTTVMTLLSSWVFQCIEMFTYSATTYIHAIGPVTMAVSAQGYSPINTLRPIQNGCRFANDTFKRICLKENVIISITISLNFVPNGPINNIPAMGHRMTWHRQGDKPLSAPMTTDAYMRLSELRNNHQRASLSNNITLSTSMLFINFLPGIVSSKISYSNFVPSTIFQVGYE